MKEFLIKKVFIFFIFLLVSVFVYQQYISRFKYSDIFINYNKINDIDNKPDIILFGSSIENHIDINSKSNYRISEILDTLTYKKVIHISNPGFYMPVYHSFLKSISNFQSNKSLIALVPINMRSFSSTWYGSRYNQFRDIDIALSPEIFFNKNYFSSESIKNNPIGCSSNIMFSEFMSTFFMSAGDNELEKCVYYQIEINSNNYVLKFLKDILELQSNNLEVVFYFESLDYLELDYAQSKQLDKNIEIIKSLLNNYQSNYIDLSKSLNSNLFDYGKTFNEHLKQEGKYLTAKFLKDSIL